MKLIRKILSAFISLTIIGASAAVPASYAALENASDELIASVQEAESLESVALQLRQKLKERSEAFTLTIPRSLLSSSADAEYIVEYALRETGVSTEGDYIRWCIRSYGYSSTYSSAANAYIFTYNFVYNTNAEQEKAADEAVKSILSSIDTGSGTEYEKIAAVYGWVVSNVKFTNRTNDTTIFSAYGAAVNCEAVCQGYAVLTYRLLTELGVSCRVIPGTGNSDNHAWNIAAVDGNYYYLDPTWDSSANAAKYLFFLRGTDDFDQLSAGNYHSREWTHQSSPLYADYDDGTFEARYPIAAEAYTLPADESTYTLGDVDRDSMVNSSDASAVLAAYSQLSTSGNSGLTVAQRLAADVDMNGYIDSKDASFILSYYAFLSTGGSGSMRDFMNK